MFRSTKILPAFVAGAALLTLPPAADGQQVRLIVGTPTGHLPAVTIQGAHGVVSTHTPQGDMPIKIGNFTVSFFGTSSRKSRPHTARMELKATVKGGVGQTLLIQFTDTGFKQAGSNNFSEAVALDFIGPGSATFQAFKDFTNSAFGTSGPTPGVMGPFGDLQSTGADATMVTDNGDYSMTLDTTVMGADVSFDFLAANGPGEAVLPPPYPPPPSTGTTTTVASSNNTSFFGQSVTFTATVSPVSGSGTPTGTVQFQIDGVNAGSPVPVSTSDGVTTATFTTRDLSAGTHTITAIYSGDNNFAPSIGNLEGGQTVNPS
jgi:hypothetical protein